MTTWYDRARFGLIAHYTFGGIAYPQTVDSSGATSTSVSDLAAAFDVDHFAANAAAFGAEYVVFTAWHYAMYVLYPSAVMDTWIPNHTSTRDLIADLITALQARGIRLILYVHPAVGSVFTANEQTATGWNDATNNYATWSTFVNAVLTELGLRYGTGIDGYWVDSIYAGRFSTNSASFGPSLRAGNAERVIVGNAVDDTELPQLASMIDRFAREYYGGTPRPAAIGDWTPSYNQTVTQASATQWWAIISKTWGTGIHFTAAQLARYSVLQAGCNLYGGGILWGAGPYSGTDVSIWEPNVETVLTATGTLLAPFAAGLRNVLPSPSYVTPNTVTLNTLPAFVATMSADGLTEYIHVLNPPAGSLTLSAPADRTRVTFTAAENLGSGRPVHLAATPAGGYVLTLDPADSWSAVDTVLALTRGTWPNTSLGRQWREVPIRSASPAPYR